VEKYFTIISIPCKFQQNLSQTMAKCPKAFKVHLHEILDSRFFHKKQTPGPLIPALVYFVI
jgi:hypothetical protein